MNTEKFLYKELTGEIIDSACNVHNVLGRGLLEKVYENSLALELQLTWIIHAKHEQSTHWASTSACYQAFAPLGLSSGRRQGFRL